MNPEISNETDNENSMEMLKPKSTKKRSCPSESQFHTIQKCARTEDNEFVFMERGHHDEVFKKLSVAPESVNSADDVVPQRRRFSIMAPSRSTLIPRGPSRIPFHVEVPKNPKTQSINSLITIIPGKPLPEGIAPTKVEEKKKEMKMEDNEKKEEEMKEEKISQIRVGTEYQAECPDFIEFPPGQDYEDRDVPIWAPPSSVGQKDNEEFYKSIKEELWFAIWRQYESQIPYETVLNALQRNGYSIPKTLDVIDQYLKIVPQKMKDPTVGQVKQLLEVGDMEKTSNREIQEKMLRNYHIGEVYLYRWRFARFYGKEDDCRELYEPRVADCFNEKWEKQQEHDRIQRDEEIEALRKKLRTEDETKLKAEWISMQNKARRRFMVQNGLNGKVGCNCLENMCREVSYEPRYGCSRCTNSLRARKLAPELVCLICQTFKEVTGLNRQMRAPVFDEENTKKLKKWIQMEENLGMSLSREDFEKKLKEGNDQRWERLELTEEEVLTLNFDKLNLDGKHGKGKLRKQVRDQLQPHILPHFGICQCKKSGSIPSGSKNFLRKFPHLLGRETAFDEDDKKLFCDVITKHPRDLEAASKESGFEMELLEMFLKTYPATDPIWKNHPKNNYHNVKKRAPLPSINWPKNPKSLNFVQPS